MIKHFSIKSTTHLQKIHPVLLRIFAEANLYCSLNGLEFKCTSMIRNPGDGISVSSTHQTGRAFDMSIRGWDEFDIEEFTRYIDDTFGKYGAVTKSGEQRLIVRHDSGYGDHLHIQIHSKYIIWGD